MSALPSATRRRLLKLPQELGVWEGGWQTLPQQGRGTASEGCCILWAERTQAFVRAIEVLENTSPEPEVIARLLLRAMENPQHPSRPARPKKIVVQDRELQFYLRGVLQDLEIQVEYTPALPLITEVFEGLKSFLQLPEDPFDYPEELDDLADTLWQQAPWQVLSDHHILALELNQWDLGTLYLSLMGNGQMEYGVLIYRTLDSLRQFRRQAVASQDRLPSMEDMQAAFLSQDCLFLNYEPVEPEPQILPLFGAQALEDADSDELVADFGSIHPIEGMRNQLHEEEMTVMYVTLTALSQFWRRHQRTLRSKTTLDSLPSVSSQLNIDIPDVLGGGSLPVTLSTQPQLAAELLALDGEDETGDGDRNRHLLQDDLLPEKSLYSMGALPWDMVDLVRLQVSHHQPGKTKTAGDGLPVLMVQTSQPKAKTLIASLKKAGGIEALGFTTGVDPLRGGRYELGIVKTLDHQLHLFGEFNDDNAVHQQARKKWQRRCQQTKGWCGVLITKGLTGASRGNPKPQDMLALFEVPTRSGQELGIGELQMMPMPD
jgi:hypothetical protein